ncbi:MAG TPA: sugar ABC transporter ATP-binding protein [Chthoniobacteraceae bacterium]|nr:sugar ABC transporter ATP-binding protein [Chthoniobacteraceae bacterium]
MTPAAISLLAARNITKRFGGVIALRDVSFDLRAGEIHALCGENGAGKSTLIKLLSGIHPHGSYEGELLIDARPAHFNSIADAQRAGLAVIYQELALVDEMTVAENIFLGAEPRRALGLIDWPQVHREAKRLLDRFNVRIDPDARCGRLGVGEKQLVEIVKALGKKSRILILDEPTAALAEHEVQVLLEIVRDLRARGIACIYISHKLDEVFAIADRITVLRDGAAVATHETAQTTQNDIIREMVGRELETLFPARTARASSKQADREDLRVTGTEDAAGHHNEHLRVTGLTVSDPRTRRIVLHDISFAVAPGEGLGIGGLMGAGRTELLLHLFGAWGTREAGEITIGGEPLPAARPAEMLKRGLALVPEDRRRHGLILEKSVAFNLSLSTLSTLSRAHCVIESSREHQASQRMFGALGIRAAGLDSIVAALSGGNQQKVVLGKALMPEPRVIFLDEPTRGIDIGAKFEIYKIVNRLAEAGKAIVLVSSELPELIGMSDRILMLREGRITGSFRREEATQEKLMRAAIGQAAETAP